MTSPVTGNLDLDGALTDVVDLSVSGTSDLGADVTTSGTQTYRVQLTLSTNVTLTSRRYSNVTFSSTVDGDGTARDLTIDTNGTTGTILFDGLVGNSNDLDAITITGNLDLDADDC